MSTYTTNYNLAKPAEGDTDWASEVNGNFDTLDTEIKSLSNTIAQNSAQRHVQLHSLGSTNDHTVCTLAQLNALLSDEQVLGVSHLSTFDHSLLTSHASRHEVGGADLITGQLLTGLQTSDSPGFTGLTLSGLTASRLLATDGSKALSSVANLASWVAGTSNQITVTDDADGTITLSTPQDIHTGASPTFADLTLSAPVNIYSLSHDSFSSRTHDGDTLQLDGVNSNGGAFSFTTSGAVSFTQNIDIPVTTSTVGQITQGGTRLIHTYGGLNNLFIGSGAGNFTCTSTSSVGVGTDCLKNLTTGIGNMAMGGQALDACQNGNYNMAIGVGALGALTSGANNVAIGNSAGAVCNGSSNVFIGYSAGVVNNSNNNVMIGTDAGRLCTSPDNVLIGFRAGYDLVSGYYNTFIGAYAGQNNTAYYNVMIGHSAGNTSTSSWYSTIIGYQAGYTLGTNNGAVMVGHKAGYYETGANKLFIDNTSRASEADGRVKSLVYGEFNAATASQLFRVNGTLEVLEAATFSNTIAANGNVTLANTKDLLFATDGGSEVGSAASRAGCVYTDAIEMAGVTISSIATTVGDPGADTTLVTEQGIREALDAAGEVVFKSADESLASSTTMQNDDDLVVALASGKTYTFEIHALVYIHGDPDFKFDFSCPANTWSRLFGRAIRAENTFTSTAPWGGENSDITTDMVMAFSTAHDDYYLTIVGMIVTTDSGDLQFRWAQNVSNATAVIVRQGSWMRVTEVA